MREREPAMKALSKRVNARTGKVEVTAAPATGQAAANSSGATGERGPRNQPKRKKSGKRK